MTPIISRESAKFFIYELEIVYPEIQEADHHYSVDYGTSTCFWVRSEIHDHQHHLVIRMSAIHVLVLCTGNSCRSQMAHGYLKQFLSGRAEVYSAGVERHGLNPFAVQVMMEDGVDISGHTSNLVDEYAKLPITHLLTVCDHAQESCPVFWGDCKRTHHSFSDPSKLVLEGEDRLNAFRKTRDEIKAFCRDYAEEITG